MFRTIRQSINSETTNQVRLRFENQDIVAVDNDTVAAALLAAGVGHFRSSVSSDEPRGPFCLIGNCFDCLLEIDGVPNQQSCQVRVRQGMVVRCQCGVRAAKPDKAP